MTVRGVELTSIEGRRYARPQERVGQVKIDHNSTVTLIKQTSPREANIEFRYTANYQAIGLIKVEGSMHWEGDAANLHARWQDNGQMPPEVASEVHTMVMRVCVPEAVAIAKDLNLPPPIPLPAVKFEEQKKPPAGGPEVA